MNICSENTTDAPRFLVLGFQIQPELKFFLFLLFSSIYLATVVGNTLILTTVAASNTLHSPMYFLLGNLSSLEICFTTNTAPTMLGGFLSSTITVSLSGCVVQLHALGWLTCTECVLLTLMAYDRYLAICYPLHYGSLMSGTVCLKLVLCIWTSGFLAAMIISLLIYQLNFPAQPRIDHFICDFVPLLKAACSDVSLPEMFRLVASFTVTLIPCFLIVTSYVCIISTILKIPLATGRQKAFSTCSSHLLVVAMYFGTLIALYVAPSTGNSLTLNKALSLLYTVATPLFNPIIYTLRNKEIREGLRHTFRTISRKQGDGGGKLNKRKT